MENICNFEPLWKEGKAIARPNEAILDIRIRSIRIFLEKSRSKPAKSLSIEYILSECIYIINALFYTWASSNAIIDRLLTLAVQGQHIPLHVIRGAMALWYTSSISVFARDPQQGLPPDAEIEVDDDGTTILRWSREHAAELHHVGNLGLMAMLLTSEIWHTSELPKLRLAALISNATTTILFAAFMISSQMESIHSWGYALSACPNDEGMKLFLRSSWQLAREGIHRAITSPGIEFGTTLDEVKLSRDDLIRYDTQLHLIFNQTKNSLKTGRSRKTMEYEAREIQFIDLATKTGRQYPMSNPAELTANFAEDIDQEYLYTVPMVKKPITDLRGDLTLPFLTTAARAIRFEDEPDEVERGFFIMTFTR
ncbi:hypothetical protein PT974_01317 [Cladobotryum mycophilum]|uniref:MAT1-1-2 n=1 Tax=Cladobotryum mycophilum TaxID=491253 RepID=A0ABR0T3B0_9HYPO